MAALGSLSAIVPAVSVGEPTSPVPKKHTRQHHFVINGRVLFEQFLAAYLGVKIQGVQKSFANGCPCLILFAGPRIPRLGYATLAVPVDIMLLPRHQARKVILNKLRESRAAFKKNAKRKEAALTLSPTQR